MTLYTTEKKGQLPRCVHKRVFTIKYRQQPLRLRLGLRSMWESNRIQMIGVSTPGTWPKDPRAPNGQDTTHFKLEHCQMADQQQHDVRRVKFVGYLRDDIRGRIGAVFTIYRRADGAYESSDIFIELCRSAFWFGGQIVIFHSRHPLI